MSETYVFPLPPSTNSIWRRAKRGMMKSDRAVAYERDLAFRAIQQRVKSITGPVALDISVYRASKRGDLDNYLKSLLDCLQGIGYENDSQVVEIHAYRYDDAANPRVEVGITQSQIEIEPVKRSRKKALK